ncbi:hypothetical protein ABZ208_03695 [Streptomyces sp. NPDC006208]|uniref:hypothetical protein n=1 Tax=Streptomyces sp. NPDC006208 TaxID=3156734 RepID=UPI0033A8CE38
MITRYFAHQSCEPDDELTADEAARRPHHVRRIDAGAGSIVERIHEGAIHEVIYDGLEPAGHAARYGAVPYEVVRTTQTTTGRVIERGCHRADGTLTTRARTEIDLDGRPQVEEYFDGAGAPTSRDVYAWHGDRLRQVVTHQPDGRSIVTYQADDDGDDDAPVDAMRVPAVRTVPCRPCGRTGTCATCRGTGISPLRHLPEAAPADGRCRSCKGSKRCNQCKGQGRWHPVGPYRPAREVADPGFALCYECHGTRGCALCEGTTFDDDALPWCRACDYGTCSTCFGEGQIAAAPGTASALRTITFEQGHPTAADAPWGQQSLTLTTDGTLGYQQQVKGEVRSVRGRVDPTRIEGLLVALARTSFPAAPQQTFLPGASVITLVVEPGGRVVIDYFVALELDGYREVIRVLGDLNTALRKHDAPALSAWRFKPHA